MKPVSIRQGRRVWNRVGVRRGPASASARFRRCLLALPFGWFLAGVSTGVFSLAGVGLAALGFLGGAVGALSPERLPVGAPHAPDVYHRWGDHPAHGRRHVGRADG